MRTHSQLERWILDTYGGETPSEAMIAVANTQRIKAGQNEFPIKLSKIAESIGLNPKPIFKKNIVEDGSLYVKDGELRIALPLSARKSTMDIRKTLGRDRFTYAHEIAHSFFYDLTTSPPKRIAPRVYHNEEEFVCNLIARELLLPKELLRAEITNSTIVNASQLICLAKKAIVSILALTMQLCDKRTMITPRGAFYLLSRSQCGARGKGVKKPRCVTSIWNDEGKLKRFLPPYKGLDSVRSAQSSLKNWSLASFHKNLYKGMYTPAETVKREVIILPDGIQIEISAVHERIQKTTYVWTAGKARR